MKNILSFLAILLLLPTVLYGAVPSDGGGIPDGDNGDFTCSDGSCTIDSGLTKSFAAITITGASTTNKDYTANSGAAITLSPANGYSQGITLNSATPVITLTTDPSATTETEMVVDIIQDGTGGRIPSWANVTWATGYAPSIAQGIGAVTHLTFKGTTRGWRGFESQGIYQGILFTRLVEANVAGSGSPNIITSSESGSVYTNEGTTAKNYHTLPLAAAGLTGTWCVQDADGMRVVANTGDTIRIGASVSTTAGNADSTDIGSCLSLVAINATEWFATSATGTWSLN